MSLSVSKNQCKSFVGGGGVCLRLKFNTFYDKNIAFISE